MFDKIIGKAKQTADDFKERAEVVSDKVTDSVNSVLDELNAATPSLTKAGYQLQEVELEVGVPPKLIPRFSICQPQPNSVEQITEELKQNRLGRNILKGLNAANSLQSKLAVPNMEFSHIEIEIGVVPTIKLRYRQLLQSESSALPSSEQE